MDVKFSTSFTYFLIFCTSTCLVSSINVASTKWPRVPRPTISTSQVRSAQGIVPITTTTAPVTEKNKPMYRVKTKTGQTCILLGTDAIMDLKFKTNLGEEVIPDFVPDKVMVEGDCHNEDEAVMSISWSGYRLELSFAKTPGGEKWYMSRVILVVSVSKIASTHHYHTITDKGSTFRLVNDSMMFPTPVGRSYTCEDSPIELVPDKESSGSVDVSALLTFRLLQIQPFMYKSEQFSSEFACSTEALYRDETVPIAVGSTLAVATLGMISGYAAWRHFKVKKVQYNTME